jgi:hypothetical protein
MLTRVAVWSILAAALVFVLYSGTVQNTSLRVALITALAGIAIVYLFLSVSRGSAKQNKLEEVDRVMQAEEQDHR